MASLCHPWFTTTTFSYRFPIFETSATALCGNTGIYIYIIGYSSLVFPYKFHYGIDGGILHFQTQFNPFHLISDSRRWPRSVLKRLTHPSYMPCTTAQFHRWCLFGRYRCGRCSGRRWRRCQEGSKGLSLGKANATNHPNDFPWMDVIETIPKCGSFMM